MSRWTDKFDQHPIHETIQWLHDSLEQLTGEVSQGEIEERRRLIKILNELKQILKNSDPEIVPFNQLDTLNTHFRHQNIVNWLNAYKNNKDVKNLSNINDYIINQLTQVSILKALSSASIDKESHFEGLEALIDESMRRIVDERDSLLSELIELKEDASRQNDKLNQLENSLAQKQKELESLTSEWQGQFSSSQESRSQEFSKWRDSYISGANKELDSLIENYEQKLKESKASFDEQLGRLTKDAKSKHNSILELYQLTAGDSVGAAYIEDAKTEGKQANKWRRISIGFIIVTLIWLISSYIWGSTTAEMSSFWHSLLLKGAISAVMLWGAAYSAQQSTKHRGNEKKAKWFALEVKAFDPFISTLENTERAELKKKLTERIFGQNLNSETEEQGSRVRDEHISTIISDAIAKVVEKLPNK